VGFWDNLEALRWTPPNQKPLFSLRFSLLRPRLHCTAQSHSAQSRQTDLLLKKSQKLTFFKKPNKAILLFSPNYTRDGCATNGFCQSSQEAEVARRRLQWIPPPSQQAFFPYGILLNVKQILRIRWKTVR
jgi:hypothetical protein